MSEPPPETIAGETAPPSIFTYKLGQKVDYAGSFYPHAQPAEGNSGYAPLDDVPVLALVEFNESPYYALAHPGGKPAADWAKAWPAMEVKEGKLPPAGTLVLAPENKVSPVRELYCISCGQPGPLFVPNSGGQCPPCWLAMRNWVMNGRREFSESARRCCPYCNYMGDAAADFKLVRIMEGKHLKYGIHECPGCHAQFEAVKFLLPEEKKRHYAG